MGLGSAVNYETVFGSVSTVDIPSGLVVLWPSTSSVPSGWVKCDGTNGTVDMRGYYARGTPSGDLVNRTYGSASHTHSAPHAHTGCVCGHTHAVAQHYHTVYSHDHTVPAHCHTTIAHSHSMPGHTHTASHKHSVAGHTHTVSSHAHQIVDHCHTAGTLCSTSFAHNWDWFEGEYCASGWAGVGYIDDHPAGPISGYTGGLSGTLYTDYASPNTEASAGADTEYFNGATEANLSTTSGETPGTGNAGSGTTDAYDPYTSTDGATATGSAGASLTVDSCNLVTGSGDTIPATINVEYIMRL